MVNVKYGIYEDGVCIPIEDIKSVVMEEVLEELSEQKRRSNKQKEAYKKLRAKKNLKY